MPSHLLPLVNPTQFHLEIKPSRAWGKEPQHTSTLNRTYPSGVKETRTYDAMGRLLTMSTATPSGEGFAMAYEYDAVGSARRMEQTSSNLSGKAQDAATTWGYDDRYRLTAETVTPSTGAVSRTEYDWDSADNRLAMRKYVGGTLAATTTYTNNALNQMTGWGNGATNVVYQYDANGARTNMVRAAGGSPATTAYTYDEDNRLVQAVAGVGDPGEATSVFAYDYRSRRYYRYKSDDLTPHMYCVFDGGLSVQEYTVPQASSLPSDTHLPSTEFIRGEGMGGGVGGMVYSIKDDGSGNDDIICSHANHRGDVIARTDSSGSLTSFALYEAYGTRPYEWGDDPDRQKANTKEEEIDLGILNEGMRPRDLYTGVWLTRDPVGYADGPNLYCYVHCNPITKFDALGLFETEAEKEAYDAAYQALLDGTDLEDLDLGQDILDALEEAYGNGKLEGDADSTCKIYFGDLEEEFGEKGKDKDAVYDPATGKIHFSKSLLGDGKKNDLAASAAHEGTHKVQHGDDPKLGKKGHYSREHEKEAYTVQGYVEDQLNGKFNNSDRYAGPKNEATIDRRVDKDYPRLKSDSSVKTDGIDQLKNSYSDKYDAFTTKTGGKDSFSKNKAGREAREKWLNRKWENNKQ